MKRLDGGKKGGKVDGETGSKKKKRKRRDWKGKKKRCIKGVKEERRIKQTELEKTSAEKQ